MQISIIAISAENSETLDKFFDNNKGYFPEHILVQEYRKINRKFGVDVIPQFFLIDESGKLISKQNGFKASEGLNLEVSEEE